MSKYGGSYASVPMMPDDGGTDEAYRLSDALIGKKRKLRDIVAQPMSGPGGERRMSLADALNPLGDPDEDGLQFGMY